MCAAILWSEKLSPQAESLILTPRFIALVSVGREERL
jgi:hypothetical protein